MQQLRQALAIALILTGLVVGVATADNQAVEPDNYCLTVDVEATTSGYNVNATGAGRYARVQDLTAAQTVVATDFGPGATQYAWTGLALDVEHEYQVQVSHTSLTAGYSTSGCLFTPPIPQAVVIDRFEIVGGAFEWDATEDGMGYWVEYHGKLVTAWTPAQAPGVWGWFSYRVLPIPTMSRNLPIGIYSLWAQDITGASGIVATYLHLAAKADEPVIWKQHCPRYYDIVTTPASDWGGVHVMCIRAAEEVTPDNTD